jgi:hypothetical protein
MKIYNHQKTTIGNNIYSYRMRQYLNEQFPETMEIDNKELEQIILDLTERAAAYKLILETHVTPFIVAAWIMGLEFDQNFIAAKEVLENLNMGSPVGRNKLV